MTAEVILSFPNEKQVMAEFAGERTTALDFANPITEKDRDDIRWYLEVYGTQWTADLDDPKADRIVANFKAWGDALFQTAFGNDHAKRLFWRFYDGLDNAGGLITIDAAAPAVLSLPWELLCKDGKHLVHESPHIAVRRRLTGAGGTGRKFIPASKDTLHLLFVVSRPVGAGFLDPRADARAVMDALEENAPGRVSVEFLRPATLRNLSERLENLGKHRNKPRVDILHFDGHGMFDKTEKTGFLLFENRSSGGNPVSADALSKLLSEHQISLLLLSACQSSALDEDDPISGVAANLVYNGIPCVIAMSYTVLVSTAKMLFGRFYAGLADGMAVGAALENARRFLFDHPNRGERRRGEHDRFTLNLYDWFSPSLYQDGEDIPLLIRQVSSNRSVKTVSDSEKENMSEQGRIPSAPITGFQGRSKELWLLERLFNAGVRRVTVCGFGGQGKTELAAEAGRWLVRTGMFQKCCFVDYAAYQGTDPTALAVSSLGVILEKNLPDANKTADALEEIPTLLILDNLESLDSKLQTELLNIAVQWSHSGETRILITTRQEKLEHPDFGESMNPEHRYLKLEGLSEQDALTLFSVLWEQAPHPSQPLPKSYELLNLLRKVDFHPLSVALLAFQLKTRKVAELGERLESLLAEAPGKGPDKNLRVSLDLSLERLPAEARKWLPGLGVFQGGAMEDVLLEVTQLITWPELRQALENSGLIRAERLPGVNAPYLSFHPALAPALWERLPEEEKNSLSARHRAAYYRLSEKLYHQDKKEPLAARAVALNELPNLLFAVKAALDAGEENAVDFVDNVSKFLNNFGLLRDLDDLNQRAEKAAAPGSRAWVLSQSNKGEALFNAGRHSEAEAVFRSILKSILKTMGDAPSYERLTTLNRLGRCLMMSGRTGEAVKICREAIALSEKLEQDDDVRRQTEVLQSDLATALRQMGDFAGARAAYEEGLKIDIELGDERGAAVSQGKLGTLSMREGNLPEAEKRYKQALQTFRRLNEPAHEATVQHQLGRVYHEAGQWDAAETAYRESARLEESLGNLAGATETYLNLGSMMGVAGRLSEAEIWFRRAMEGFKASGNRAHQSVAANNLAALLQNDPASLAEARQLAEQSLAIRKTLDPGAAEIWKTYGILAQIAEKQGQNDQSREYRRLSREAQENFMGTQHQVGRILEQFKPIIEMVVAACEGNEEARQALKGFLEMGRQQVPNFVAALEAILNGERNEEKLIEMAVGYNSGAVIRAILARLQ